MQEIELNRLIDRASVGDAEAIVLLIEYYLSINDKNKAALEAERLKYVRSPLAYRKLANLALTGVLDKVDIETAKNYYSKAFDFGDDASGYNLALLLIKENKPNKAIYYLSHGVANEYIPSIKLMASLYLKGDGVVKDLHIAFSLLKKVYELGDNGVVTSLGKICYQLGDYEAAFKYFNIGVNNRDLDAIYHLGLCYAKGLGTAQDLSKSRFYYEMGANLNDPNCLYNLSLYYRNGIGVNQNIQLADTLLQQAIERGFKK